MIDNNSLKSINKILYEFNIDKKYWFKDSLTGPEYDFERSKPAPYIKTAIKIAKNLNLKTVVEIGSTRFAVTQKCLDYFYSDPIDAYKSPPCCCDGHSCFFWAAEGFITHTVDIDENCKNGVLWSYNNLNNSPVPNNLHLHIPEDGIDFLQNFPTKTIDVLYLDGWDKGTYEYAENHLKAYMAAKDKLSDTHLILIDDTDFLTNDGGKDKLLSPYLLDNNYFVLFNGRQTLFINHL